MTKSELRVRRVLQRAAFIIAAAAAGAGLAATGCSSSNSNSGAGTDGGAGSGDAGGSGGSGGSKGSGGTGGSGASCASPGGADTSMSANTHCNGDGGMIKQATGMCVMDSGGDADAGMDMADAGPLSSVLGGDYGDTNYGTKAFDDDCKYEVSWTSTPICDNAEVNFTVTVTTTAGGDPVLGAKPYLEVFKIDEKSVHFPAATHQVPTEKGKGVYDVGPVKFNESGQWIVRFHLFEECSDSEDSPHGHAAFYVKVP